MRTQTGAPGPPSRRHATRGQGIQLPRKVLRQARIAPSDLCPRHPLCSLLQRMRCTPPERGARGAHRLAQRAAPRPGLVHLGAAGVARERHVVRADAARGRRADARVARDQAVQRKRAACASSGDWGSKWFSGCPKGFCFRVFPCPEAAWILGAPAAGPDTLQDAVFLRGHSGQQAWTCCVVG